MDKGKQQDVDAEGMVVSAPNGAPGMYGQPVMATESIVGVGLAV